MQRYGANRTIPAWGKNVQPLPYRKTCHPMSGPYNYIEQEMRAQSQVSPDQQI